MDTESEISSSDTGSESGSVASVDITDAFPPPPPLPDEGDYINDLDESAVQIRLQQQLAADKEKLSTILNHVYDVAKLEDDSWVLEDTQVTDLTWNDVKEGRVKPSVNSGKRWNRLRTSYVSSSNAKADNGL